MPLKVAQRNRLWRLIEPSGRVATTSKGNAVDGGGHRNRMSAEKQRRAIEMSKRAK